MYCMCSTQHASADVEKMILGNKCDINEKRQVSKDRGEKVSRPCFLFAYIKLFKMLQQ